jgi:hypothetical protein
MRFQVLKATSTKMGCCLLDYIVLDHRRQPSSVYIIQSVKRLAVSLQTEVEIFWFVS